MANQQWYMAIGGQQVGPVAQDEIVSESRSGMADGDTLVFTAGMTKWTQVQGRARVRGRASAAGAPAGGAGPARSPGRRAHEIDFEILGDEMQFVEVELDPGESAVAEAGAHDVHDARHRDGDRLRRRQRAAGRAGSWASCSAPASACSPARACS